MSIELGIYFGGSSMTIAYSRDERASVIVNEAGDRWTPSMIAINGAEYSVGLPAKQNLIRNSKNTIMYTKHFIKKNHQDIEKDLLKKLDVVTKANNENEIVFEVEKGGKSYDLTLGEAIEKQLKYLNDLAKSSLGVKECDAVLAVPHYFTKDQSDYLKEHAQKAGFNVLQMINNPIAACLAYDIEDDNSNDSLILVYQMGGNSIEVTLVDYKNGLYRIIDSVSIKNLGGDKFTDLIVDILCEEFQRKHKSNPIENKRSLSKLKSNAEELKQILSTMERAHCSIDALYDGIDFDYYLTRQRFEGVCGKIYQQVLQPVDDLLAANNLQSDQIDQVILCGAPTKMCKLQGLIKQKFPTSKLVNHQSPDEVISLGCAKQCVVLNNSKSKNLKQEEKSFKCLSAPIFLKVGNNKKCLQICSSKTPLPVKRSLNFEFDLESPFLVLQESEEKILAKIHLEAFKTKDINFLFQIKINETVEITVTETSTNQKISGFLNSESSND